MSADDELMTTVVAAAVTSSLLTDPAHTTVQYPDDGEQVPGGHVGSARSSKSHSVQIRDPPVSELGRGAPAEYTVVCRAEEKHGVLHKAIPSMPLPLAVIACILNIILPGSGTLVSAFSVFCCGTTTRINRPVVACLLNILSGLLQFVTFLLIVGWVWSITWGMAFVQYASTSTKKPYQQHQVVGVQIPYYVRRHSSVEGARTQQARHEQ